MENKEFSRKLEERTKLFALDVIRLSVLLPTTTEGKIIKNQLTKAGTSVGANYREANRSRSRADFSNKIKICESEANETNYWLEIVEALNWIPREVLTPIQREATELLALFCSIAISTRKK